MKDLLGRFEFHHVGIATEDLDGAIALHLQLGYRLAKRCEDPRQQASIAIVEKEGSPRVELVRWSESRKSAFPSSVGPYHVCYEVDAMEDAIAEIERRGFRCLSSPTPAVAFDGRKVAFFWSPVIGILELLEAKA